MSTLGSHNVVFAGNSIQTLVTDKATDIDKWVRDVYSLRAGNATIVGLDIEWRPNNLSNKTATLQLCINNKCLIVQLFYLDQIPESLKNLLSDPSFTFVGVEVGSDVEKLNHEYGFVCNKHVDIGEVAKMKWPGRYTRPGLKDLAWDILGLRVEKPEHIVLSNWEGRVLGSAQIEYACIDAYASYRIGYKLLVEA